MKEYEHSKSDMNQKTVTYLMKAYISLRCVGAPMVQFTPCLLPSRYVTYL